MGVSTDAILFYGYVWDDEYHWLNDGGQDDNAWRCYSDAEEQGLHLGSHCSSEVSMPYLAVERTHLLASRGYPESFDPAKMKPPTEVEMRTLEAFVEAWELGKPAAGPGWFLLSHWG